MRSLPLFHRIADRPVLVLGDGAMAEPKRRLVERAGGRVISDEAEGIALGARLAFIALEDAEACALASVRLRKAGVLVNVVDQPDLCEFTTPSLLERDPVLIAIGTSGASAGLAKQLRLRLEALLPASLGRLAQALNYRRKDIRARYPDGGDRRQALDAALGRNGPLDPLDEGSADRMDAWLQAPRAAPASGVVELHISSDDPEDLTFRQARLMGSADRIFYDSGIAPQILNRARADAERIELDQAECMDDLPGLSLIMRRIPD
ncbi:precorrin-2 dehydrogenase/sirohydrochlorin ferrochelatase family protein [Altericroceibacterium endophyticum]|uniref:precorrin-2 dehydrogenase n=1 Tax=Altericroceibacterium endophyticum TaxID=1808508 RepID=A0A6I4T7J0_9SPHN|nr:bifunctional precorrin-2 dehydrogenase/sirohydrochlorin ferrochelatase [Altericroceibacterium endophyticum]MXO66926.1 siroheme synthase [Altericroceibacterium endophyticum]